MIQGPLIAEGNTAEVFAWGANQVLKLYRPGYPPSEAEREASLVQAVIASDVQTPAVVDLMTIDGRAGILFERVEGPSMLEILMGAPSESSANFPEMLAKLHAELHRLTCGDLPCLHARLQNRIGETNAAPADQDAATLSPSTVAKTQAHLSQLSAGSALCHGDFGPHNVLLADEGPVIIDWVDATCGVPAADVARTVVLLTYAVLPPALDRAARERFDAFRLVFLEEYLACYCTLTGTTVDEINQWVVPVAAARPNHERIPVAERTILADVVRKGLLL